MPHAGFASRQEVGRNRQVAEQTALTAEAKDARIDPRIPTGVALGGHKQLACRVHGQSFGVERPNRQSDPGGVHERQDGFRFHSQRMLGKLDGQHENA